MPKIRRRSRVRIVFFFRPPRRIFNRRVGSVRKEEAANQKEQQASDESIPLTAPEQSNEWLGKTPIEPGATAVSAAEPSVNSTVVSFPDNFNPYACLVERLPSMLSAIPNLLVEQSPSRSYEVNMSNTHKVVSSWGVEFLSPVHKRLERRITELNQDAQKQPSDGQGNSSCQASHPDQGLAVKSLTTEYQVMPTTAQADSSKVPGLRRDTDPIDQRVTQRRATHEYCLLTVDTRETLFDQYVVDRLGKMPEGNERDPFKFPGMEGLSTPEADKIQDAQSSSFTGINGLPPSALLSRASSLADGKNITFSSICLALSDIYCVRHFLRGLSFQQLNACMALYPGKAAEGVTVFDFLHSGVTKGVLQSSKDIVNRCLSFATLRFHKVVDKKEAVEQLVRLLRLRDGVGAEHFLLTIEIDGRECVFEVMGERVLYVIATDHIVLASRADLIELMSHLPTNLWGTRPHRFSRYTIAGDFEQTLSAAYREGLEKWVPYMDYALFKFLSNS